MSRLEDQYIELMKRNRDLRMEILLLADELQEQDKMISTKEIADKLVELLSQGRD